MPNKESLSRLFHLLTEFQYVITRDPFGVVGVDEAMEKVTRDFPAPAYEDAGRALRSLIDAAVQDTSLDKAGRVPAEFFFRLHELFVLIESSFVVGRKLSFHDVDAQLACASLYRDGERLKRNPERAAFWLAKAAENDSIFALYTLAQLYLAAPEMTRNLKAIYMLERASELGDGDAPTLLASLFLEGRVVEESFARSAHWALIAARRNSPQGQRILGYLYFQGAGLEKDLISAAAWLTIASEAGDSSARPYLKAVLESAMPWQLAQVKSRIRQFRARIAVTS